MPAHRTRTERHDCTCSHHRPHGHQHTYQRHRCGCDACRTAWNLYIQNLRAGVASGRTSYVPAGPVRDHLAGLTGAGWTIRQVAAVTGWSRHTLYAISQGRGSCRRELAGDVLSIRAEAA